MKKILVIIILFFSVVSNETIARSVNKKIIKLDGVWLIDDRVKVISKLLYLKKKPNCATFCMDINVLKGEAYIYFYTYKDPFKVGLKKVDVNKYALINKKRKLILVVSERINRKPAEYDEPIERTVFMGISDLDGVLRYTQHGVRCCLWSAKGEGKCSKDEIKLCLKDAKKTDETMYDD